MLDEEDDESGEISSYASEDAPRKAGDSAALDDLFDRTLEEYGSDDMGGLDEEVRWMHHPTS